MPIPVNAEASATKSDQDTNLREPQNTLHSTPYILQNLHCDLEYDLSARSALSHKPWHRVLAGSLATDFKFWELNEFLISLHKTSRLCRLLSLFLRRGNRVQGKSQPRHSRARGRSQSPHAAAGSDCTQTQQHQLASSWNTSPRLRSVQQEFTNKLQSTL